MYRWPRNPSAGAGVATDVIVDLYSSSFCGACTATRAVLDEAARLVPAASVVERNIASAPDAAAAERIRSTPTVIVRRDDGTEVFRAEGVPTVGRVLAALALAV
jgi:thiol-disulfide isomerase/thioredoxin